MWNEVTLTGFADEIDPMLDRQIEVLKKLGMNRIEMRGVNGKPLIEHSMEAVSEIKKRLDDEGFALSSVGSSIGKIGITDDFEPHFDLFEHTVEVAHVMDTPNIRMFSFYLPVGADPARYEGEVIDRLGRMADYAKRNDVVLMHENEKGIYGDNAARCAEIMKDFYGPHFKAVFDFANFVQVGQETLPAYEALKPYIAYVHVKDAHFGTGAVCPAGSGDGHVAEILGALKASGYKGYLSLEPHLADFSGFSALELHSGFAGEPHKLSGEEAFTLAHDALVKILQVL